MRLQPAQNVIAPRIERAQYGARSSARGEKRMSKAVPLILAALIGCAPAVLAQAKPGQAQEPGRVVYESLAPGIVGAHVFTSDALKDVTVEVSDVILGPGKSAPDFLVRGIAIMELKSGEVETSIDGQTVRRRPGAYWVVRAGQRYAIKHLGGQVVIQAFNMTRRK